MALDSAQKRFSAIHVMCPWRTPAIVPSGTIGQAQRQAILFLYTGILSTAPVVIVAGPIWLWLNGTAYPPLNQVQGSQSGYWLILDGTVVIPTDPKWPAFPRKDDDDL